MKTCRNCGHPKVNRPRGLCYRCFYAPGVREMYPITSKFARRGVANFHHAAAATDPVAARPGTEEKIEALERRAELGQELFHDLDGRV